ncbi:MAG: hypothetical protein MUE81_17835, partial [Thermoflexibacter sp.]|nr:hypothetical protein [Thermoflexibacter sp.]
KEICILICVAKGKNIAPEVSLRTKEGRVSIENRPKVVENRERFGDLEIDFFFAHPYHLWERGSNRGGEP